LSGGNRERARVVDEIAPAEIARRFPQVEGRSYAKDVQKRLDALLDTPELAQVRSLESGGAKAVLQLLEHTEEVKNFYAPSGYGGEDFHELTQNVRVSRRYQPEDMEHFEVTTVEILEPEPAGVY
jgi:hypothetical protein